MEKLSSQRKALGFISCASNQKVLNDCLLASPCLQGNEYQLALYFDYGSAAEAFNHELIYQNVEWLVWVHQDVLLPEGWDRQFLKAIAQARTDFANLAVVGVYGVAGAGPNALRAGQLLDRGQPLHEPTALPCEVDSLDELLVAVRTDCGLSFDPQLGFDFYATDVVLQAQQKGLSAAVVEAYCEHHSGTPQDHLLAGLATRIIASAEVFERKWASRLPVETSCFAIDAPGAVASQCRALLERS